MNPQPAAGQMYEFDSQGKDGESKVTPLMITKVTETHVYYKFTDKEENVVFAPSHPMIKELWDKNPDGRRFVGITKDEDYLIFIQ